MSSLKLLAAVHLTATGVAQGVSEFYI